MRQRILLLAAASLIHASPHVFSVHDDVLAFPQYEVTFSDDYISDTEAQSRLSFASSAASAKSVASSLHSTFDSTETQIALSTQRYDGNAAQTEDQESGISESPETYEYMFTNSSPYLCSIPIVVQQQKNETEAAASKAEEELELTRATYRGWELLKDLEGQCLYFVSGWWSYSFCYNAEVKQFHQLPPGRGGVPAFPPVEDERVPAYILGHFDSLRGQRKNLDGSQSSGQNREGISDAVQTSQMQTKGDMRYLVQKLSGGTVCDLTGKPRKIEVQFHCHPQSADRVGWIKEVATCSYLMVIYTNRLCNDVAFLPPRETVAHRVVCREIVPEAEIETRRMRKIAEAERKALGASNPETPPHPIIGNIEVGGQHIVGKDGRRIEPPKVVKPTDGKADVVARYDPKENNGRVQKVSDKELSQMDLNPGDVKQVREELQKLAKDKAWKLEVVDTPAGRELRGIVEGDEEDEVAEEAAGNAEQEVMEPDEGFDTGSEEIYRDEL